MIPGSNLSRAFVSTALAAAFLAVSPAFATAQMCAQPISNGAVPVASDCLFILNAVVGAQTCSPECICSPSGSLPAKATDALICLAKVTGQDVALNCPCDDDPPPPPDGDPKDYVGFVDASFTRTITPPVIPFPGVPPTVTDAFELSGVFTTFDSLTPPGNTQSSQTTKMKDGCEIVTLQSTTTIDPNDLPNVDFYDPGDPGNADNGNADVDLVRMVFGQFESFEPAADPANLGFAPGQNVMFSWPGGTDINAFAGSVPVPGMIAFSSPDVAGDGFDIVPGQAVSFAWTPNPDQDGDLEIQIASSVTEISSGSNNKTIINLESVTITCPFDDASGSGTVTGAVTSELQSGATLPAIFGKSFSAIRETLVAVPVNGSGIGNSKKVLLNGSASITRSLTTGFSFPITGG